MLTYHGGTDGREFEFANKSKCLGGKEKYPQITDSKFCQSWSYVNDRIEMVLVSAVGQ